MKRILAADDIRIERARVPVTVYIEPRRQPRASIGKRGVHIRIPAWLSRGEREAQIGTLRRWAEARLKENPVSFLPPPVRSYREGERLSIGGRSYQLAIRRGGGKHGSSRIEDEQIRVRLPASLTPNQEAELMSLLIARAAGREYLPRLEETLHRLNRRHFRRNLAEVAFRDNRVIWGSCSTRGNISIATRLLLAPREVLTYVCIHELAHLVERNHSQRFWDLVEAAMPACREARLWLRANRHSCRF